jgi:hypothetical protein
MIYLLFLILIVFVLVFISSYNPRVQSLHSLEQFSNMPEKTIRECIPFHKKVGIVPLRAYQDPNIPLIPSANTSEQTYIGQRPPMVDTSIVPPTFLPSLKPKEGRLLQTKLLFDGVWDSTQTWDKKTDTMKVDWSVIPKGHMPISSIVDVKNFIRIPEKIAMNLEGYPDPNPCIEEPIPADYVRVFHNEIEQVD